MATLPLMALMPGVRPILVATPWVLTDNRPGGQDRDFQSPGIDHLVKAKYRGDSRITDHQA